MGWDKMIFGLFWFGLLNLINGLRVVRIVCDVLV